MANYVSEERFWGRLLFLESSETFLDIEANSSLPLSRSFRQGCQILLLRVRRNVLRNFFPKDFCFLIFSGLQQKFFGCSSKFFCQGCQNVILSVHRKFWRDFVPKICFFETFVDFERQSFGTCKILLVGKSKLHTKCLEKDFEEKYFLWTFLETILDEERKCFRICPKFSVSFVKTTLYVLTRIIWGFFLRFLF